MTELPEHKETRDRPEIRYRELTLAPKEARYRAIARDLETRIKYGEWGPGEQLPSESVLRSEYGAPPLLDAAGTRIREAMPASRTTIRQAVNVLGSRALVVTRQGQGTFVAQKYRRFVTTLSLDPETGFGGGEGKAYHDEVVGQERTPSVEPPEVTPKKADPIVASALRVEPGTYVIARRQQRFIDGRPYSLQTSYYKMSLVAEGASRLIEPADIEQGVVTYLKETLNIVQQGYQDTITVRAPDESESAFFGVPADGRVAVYETFRTAYDKAGMPYRLTVSVFPADRNTFIISVGDVPDTVVAKPWTPPET